MNLYNVRYTYDAEVTEAIKNPIRMSGVLHVIASSVTEAMEKSTKHLNEYGAGCIVYGSVECISKVDII